MRFYCKGAKLVPEWIVMANEVSRVVLLYFNIVLLEVLQVDFYQIDDWQSETANATNCLGE